jgi:hypothetical protein
MKKIGLVIFALIIALGSIGIGYAMWSDEITVSGEVYTAEVCIEFVDFYRSSDPCYQPSGAPAISSDLTCDPGFLNIRDVPEYKDVGCTHVDIDDEDPKVALVTLYNTYPCYFVEVALHVQNCGTIPVKLVQPTLRYEDPRNSGQYIEKPLPNGTVVYIEGEDQYGGISNVIEILWVDNLGRQLHEPPDYAEDSFFVHVLQPAKQLSTYQFEIIRSAVQWNEYQDPE